MTDTREEIVSRVENGSKTTQPHSWVERLAMIELVGLAADIRDQLTRIADSLNHLSNKESVR